MRTAAPLSAGQFNRFRDIPMHSRSPVCAVAAFMLVALAWISGCASIKATSLPADQTAEVGDVEKLSDQTAS